MLLECKIANAIIEYLEDAEFLVKKVVKKTEKTYFVPEKR